MKFPFERLNAEWEGALKKWSAYDRVVFLSSQRFWEKHGFVQQSLARELTSAGVPVTWFDGSGWRPYEPVVEPAHRLLEVTQINQLPLRRLNWIDRLSRRWESFQVRSRLKEKNTCFIWMDEINSDLASVLPPPDAWLIFDNPYPALDHPELLKAPKWVACQNSLATKLVRQAGRTDAECFFPPIEVPERISAQAPEPLPSGFPRKVMGYVGSFMGEGLDFSLIEEVLARAADWGVLLVGRTDAAGEEKLKRLTRYRNFLRRPWMPRAQALAQWRLIDVAFFPYTATLSQDGAFAVKSLEAMFYQKPILSTEVPKTQDLAGLIQFVGSAEDVAQALQRLEFSQTRGLGEPFWELAYRMHPRHYLAELAKRL